MTRLQKFGLLTSLYIAQGLPFGFFMQSLPVLLRAEGMSLEMIGFGAILVLPWALKFLWAPLLDQWGTRKQWIIGANLLAVLCMLALSFQDLQSLVSTGVMQLYAGFFLMNLLAATQDIATDATAVNQLTEDERGIGNGMQVAGYRTGMILSGGVLLGWFSVLGWTISLWLLAGLMLLATLPALGLQESHSLTPQDKPTWRDFMAFVRAPDLGWWLVLLCTYKFSDAFSGTMVRPLLIDYGFDIEQIAWVLGTVGFTAGLFGALLGGLWVNRLGRYHALMLFGVVQLVSVTAWACIPYGYGSAPVFFVLSVLEHFGGGLATAALFTVMMDHCRKNCAGSDYTIQACLVVLMSMVAAAASGISAANLGYSNHFLLCGVISLASFPVIMRYRFRLIS